MKRPIYYSLPPYIIFVDLHETRLNTMKIPVYLINLPLLYNKVPHT